MYVRAPWVNHFGFTKTPSARTATVLPMPTSPVMMPRLVGSRPSSTARTTRRWRSCSSAASRSWVWAMSSALEKRAWAPRAETMVL
jgi:hypothetical protein